MLPLWIINSHVETWFWSGTWQLRNPLTGKCTCSILALWLLFLGIVGGLTLFVSSMDLFGISSLCSSKFDISTAHLCQMELIILQALRGFIGCWGQLGFQLEGEGNDLVLVASSGVKHMVTWRDESVRKCLEFDDENFRKNWQFFFFHSMHFTIV